jgi:hypothetical protein
MHQQRTRSFLFPLPIYVTDCLIVMLSHEKCMRHHFPFIAIIDQRLKKLLYFETVILTYFNPGVSYLHLMLLPAISKGVPEIRQVRGVG